MDRPAQLIGTRPRRGIALATVLMVMVILIAIPVALFAVVSTQGRAEINRAEQRRAELIAQAGAAHATALLTKVIPGVNLTNLLLGADGVAGGGNDGILIGHPGLTAANQIPAVGVEVPGAGRYYVRVIDDEANVAADVRSGARIGGSVWADGGTHDANYLAAPFEGNNAVVIQCMGVTRDGSRATVNMRLQRNPSPGLTIGGDLQVFARVAVSGACADIHTNGNIIDTKGQANWGQSSNFPSATTWSATGTIPNYFRGNILTGQPARGMPTLPSFQELCSGASVTFYNVMNVSGGTRTQVINLDEIADGAVLCVYGHADMTCQSKCRNGSLPRIISVIATGSIRLLARTNAAFRPAQADGYQFVAGGDLDLRENTNNTELLLAAGGATFCGSQLRIDINLNVAGQVICAGRANPTEGITPSGGTVGFGNSGNYATVNEVAKMSLITFDCGGAMGNKLATAAWYPSIGS